MAPLTRKERDRQLRQQDILRAAEHVFATKGFHKAAIQDIAKVAQYATGTIYLYFKDKEALYLALLENKIRHFISSIKEKVNQTKDINAKIEVLVHEQLSYFKENQDFFRIYFSEREGMCWTIKDKLPASAVNKFVQHLDYIAFLVEEAQDAKIIRRGLDAKQLAYVLSSLMNAVILRWLRNEADKKVDLQAASAFVLDIFLNGAGWKK